MKNGDLLRSGNKLKQYIVGNPENRRVQDYQTAVERLGFEAIECVSWLDLLTNNEVAMSRLGDAEYIRLDSPGENNEVLHHLIRASKSDGRLAFGEIGFLREQYFEFCNTLHSLQSLTCTFQNSPQDIKTMFDKWVCHKTFVAAGIARPHTELACSNILEFDEFRTKFCRPSSGRVFLKPRYGSSASGVCAYRWSGDREQLIAPIEIQRNGNNIRLFNTLKVRRYSHSKDIADILGFLLPQGMICEKWIRKSQLPGGHYDLRILVIRGEARHRVVRQSHHPMTNLHLGNRRGDLEEVRSVIGTEKLEHCSRIAEQASNCFADSLHAGVDVLVPARGEPMVCEINAFGDLLPNLCHHGESPYEAIAKASNVCGYPV